MFVTVPVLMWVMTLLYAFVDSGYETLKHCRCSTMQCLLGNRPVCGSVDAKTVADESLHANGSVAEKEVAYAQGQLGLPYVTGGPTNGSLTHPNNFDCSGLSRNAVLYATGGKLNLMHHAATQMAQLSKYPVSKNPSAWQPGDLIFYFIPGDASTPGHVAIYIGNGEVIAAPRPGENVQRQPWSQGPGTYVMGVRRPADAPLAGGGKKASTKSTRHLKVAA